MPSRGEVRLRGITKRFGDLRVFDGLDLDIRPGKTLAVLGPSGCGKTTLLRIVAGLDRDFTGQREVAENGRFSFAFQDPRLLPGLGARGNALFALEGSALPLHERAERVERLIQLAGLAGHGDRPARELSGGMRQRAGLLRAFAYPSDILLLDEAFQSVDIVTKSGLLHLFAALVEEDRRSVLLVTHDPFEAALVADRVIVLGGKPSRILLDLEPEPPRAERRPGSPRTAEVEACLRSALLAEGAEPR